MNFKGPLLVVTDLQASKTFYQEVLEQTIQFDFGENIVFECGLSLQLRPHFAKMLEIDEQGILKGTHNFELYFETDELDRAIAQLEARYSPIYIQRLVEHPWGQRVTRFYDPDRNIIELGESMNSVVKRMLREGCSVEETANKSQHPIAYVKACYEELR